MPYECVECREQYDKVEGPCSKCGGSRYFTIPVPTILQRIQTIAYFSVVGWFTSRVLVFHIRRIEGPARFDLGAHNWGDLLFFLFCLLLYIPACFVIVWFVKAFDRRLPSVARKESGNLLAVLVMASILIIAVWVTFDLLNSVFQS